MSFHLLTNGFWFRVFGYGFVVSNQPLTFSERNGYKKVLRAFGWKIGVLTP